MSDVQLSDYVSGRLSDSEKARLQRGLDSCEYCRQELLTWETTSAALRALPELELPRSFVMLEAPAPAQGRRQGAGFNAMAGLGRLPSLSPWVYAGAASLAALAGALIVTTQGGLPWSGTEEGLMSDAATKQAPVAVARQMDSGAESLKASQPHIVPASPQIAASPAGEVEGSDERVSAMVARSMVTREAASRRAQAVPQDMSKEASAIREKAEPEPEALSKAAPLPKAQMATATPQAMAALPPAAVPASAEALAEVEVEVEVQKADSEAPQSAEVAAAREAPAVVPQAEPGTIVPVVPEAAEESDVAARPSSGYALDAAQAPTVAPAARDSAAPAVPENPSVPSVRDVTGDAGTTSAFEHRGETGPPADGGKETSQVQTPTVEVQESGIAEVEAPAAMQRADTLPPQQEGIEGEDGTEVVQVSVTPEPMLGEQAAEGTAEEEKVPGDTGSEANAREPTPPLPGNVARLARATPMMTPEAVSKLAVSPQGEMAEQAEEKRRAAATGPGAGETGSQGESHSPQGPAPKETVFRFVWVVGGLLTLVALALGGYLVYRANRSRISTN
ncbi:MAG: hypothetical protein F4X65_15500 [Chloroflexi bacterium]|nr:hypothetical protein [Chloroflexota bacterium]